MKSIRTFVAAAAAMTAISGAALAQEATADYTITKNVTVVSDYMFRGISQSDEAPALQGSIGYENVSGFHASVWGSTINFANDDEEKVEIDLTAGYAFTAHGIDFDLGAIQYYYPNTAGSNNYDFLEVYASAAKDFGPVSTAFSVNHTGDYFAASGDAQYYNLSASMPIAQVEGLSVSANVGRQIIEDNAAFGTPDYTDGSLGVNYNYMGYDIGLAYVDTSLSKNECADGCEARAVLSISRDF